MRGTRRKHIAYVFAFAALESASGFALVGCDHAPAGSANPAADGVGAGPAVSYTTYLGVGACPAETAPPSEGACVPFRVTRGTDGSGDDGSGNDGSGDDDAEDDGDDAPQAAFSCNPVTGAGCHADESCDAVFVPGSDRLVGFRCFDGPNAATECAPCDEFVGPFCVNGTSCYEGECREFCCSAEDCAPGADCVYEVDGDPLFSGTDLLGLCLPGEVQ